MLISGFSIDEDGVISIENFRLSKKRNCHSSCSFLAHVYENDKEKFMGKVGKDLDVKVKFESDEKTVFYGVIDEIVLHENFHQTMVEVHAVSFSLLNDEKFHWRIFQNPDKTIGDVVRELKLEKGEIEFSHSGISVENLKLPKVILQNQETDFVFLRWLAKYCGSSLWVKDSYDSRECGFCFGEIGEKKECQIEIRNVRKIRRMEGRRANGLAIVTKEYFPCGSKAAVEGYGEYLIVSLLLEKQHGVDVFTYELEKLQNRKEERFKSNCQIKTVKLLAEVTNNKDPENNARIRVHFFGQQIEKGRTNDSIEDNTPEDKRFWIPYRTLYCGKGSGIVFLPDAGDLVEVILSNEECYAVSAYRQQSLNQECQSIDDKYIGNNTEQRIFWKEKSLEFKSYENSVVLEKDKIELKVADSVITLTKDFVCLKVKDNVFVLDGKDAKFKTNNSFGIEINKDFTVKSGSKCNLQAKGDVIFKGSGVTIKAKGDVDLNGGRVNIS